MSYKHVLYFAECAAGKFSCSNGRCVNMRDVCDYYNDCGDLSDEKNENCSYTPRKYSALIVISLITVYL